jgi:hypothetical protein
MVSDGVRWRVYTDPLKTVPYYPHLVSANIREIRNVMQRFVGSIRQKPEDIVQVNLAQHWQQLCTAADIFLVTTISAII